MTASIAYSTATPQAYVAVGSLKGTVLAVTLAANDYVTGGIDVSSYLPSSSVVGAIVLANTGAGAVTQVPSFDSANKKLQLIKGTAGANAEVSNGSSDAQVVTILVLTLA